MRPYAVAEVEVSDDFLRGDVDDDQVLAVGSGLADAGVSVDGHVGEAAVGRRDDLMAGYATLLDGSDDLSRCRIDDAEACVSLLRNKQTALLGEDGRDGQQQHQRGESESNRPQRNLREPRNDYTPQPATRGSGSIPVMICFKGE